MIKPIRLTGNQLELKVKCLSAICFGGCAEAELKALTCLIQYSTNNSICLTIDVSKQIIVSAGIGRSAFSTALFRLEKKGIIVRSGKTITLHPVFNKIDETEKILISFSAE
jgi:DNA-binding MarR family transcriptional regulator